MNTTQLKSYAPNARRAFIAAVSAKAARLGIRAAGNSPAEIQGDVLLIQGQAFLGSIASARRSLVDRVEAHGFDQTMESIAYTWFNRFVAIRYMELHGYLHHGYPVLSHPEAAGRPEILDHAADVDLPGLDREKAIELGWHQPVVIDDDLGVSAAGYAERPGFQDLIARITMRQAGNGLCVDASRLSRTSRGCAQLF